MAVDITVAGIKCRYEDKIWHSKDKGLEGLLNAASQLPDMYTSPSTPEILAVENLLAHLEPLGPVEILHWDTDTDPELDSEGRLIIY